MLFNPNDPSPLQIELECVAYGYPKVNIFWRKIGRVEPEKYKFNNDGKTTQVNANAKAITIFTIVLCSRNPLTHGGLS